MNRVLSSVLVLFVSLCLSLTVLSCTKKEEEETKEGAAEVIDNAMDKAQEVKEQAVEKVEQIQEQAGEVVEGAKKQVDQMAEQAGEITKDAQNMAEDAAQKAEKMAGEAKEIVVAQAPVTKGDAGKGKEKFELICASCHGPLGHGDGPAAAALDPKPRNLSDASYVSTLSDEHIFKTVKEGGASVGKSPLMPAWGGTLSDDDIWNVIAYLREDICKCQHKGN